MLRLRATQHEEYANAIVSQQLKVTKLLFHPVAGNAGIGHVRYPTAGSASAQEAQPFFVNSPLGIYLIHNGNLTNVEDLRLTLEGSQSFFNRHLRTESDSEVHIVWVKRLRGWDV